MPVRVDAAELPDASAATGTTVPPLPSFGMLLLNPAPAALPVMGPRPNGVLNANGAIGRPLSLGMVPFGPRCPATAMFWPKVLGERSSAAPPPLLAAGRDPADSREMGSGGDGLNGGRGGSACCPFAVGELPASARNIVPCVPGSEEARRPMAAGWPLLSPAAGIPPGGPAGWNPFRSAAALPGGMGTGWLGLDRGWKRRTGGAVTTPQDGEPPVKLPAPLWYDPTAELAPSPGEKATAPLLWDCVPAAPSCSADAGVPPPLPPGMASGCDGPPGIMRGVILSWLLPAPPGEPSCWLPALTVLSRSHVCEAPFSSPAPRPPGVQTPAAHRIEQYTHIKIEAHAVGLYEPCWSHALHRAGELTLQGQYGA